MDFIGDVMIKVCFDCRYGCERGGSSGVRRCEDICGVYGLFNVLCENLILLFNENCIERRFIFVCRWRC